MKNRKIILIGALAAAAMIILLLMQLYWLQTAAKLKEQHFEHSVSRAIEVVIAKLEDLSFEKPDYKNTFKYEEENLASDSLRKKFYKFYKVDSVYYDTLKIKQRYSNFRNNAGNNYDPLINHKYYSLSENKINVKLLDSIIKAELANKNIFIKFEFGIYNPAKHMLIIQKTGKFTSELINNSLKFNLYPASIFMQPEYLYIYFPKKKIYILSNMWEVMLFSVLLVFILVFIFIYTISTLVKQKKFDDLKSDLINNLSHEFKTPISTISLACEALNDKDLLKSSALFENYLKIIMEENRRLGIMAENVLQAAVIDKGYLKLNKTEIILHELLSEIINGFKLQVESRNGGIICEFNAYNDIIHGDKDHLAVVFQNILDNANKYSPFNPQIKVKTQNVDEGIIVSISDNGIGISKSNQKRIFENLFRVPTGNIHETRGYGLGLSYVKAIIEKHNGSISVESDLKKGATFNILIPFY